MVIELTLDVRIGDETLVHEIEVPVETEVHSYTPEERATPDSPGSTAAIEWTMRTSAAVSVNNVEVMPEGTVITPPPVVRAGIEDRLIRDAQADAAVSGVGG